MNTKNVEPGELPDDASQVDYVDHINPLNHLSLEDIVPIKRPGVNGRAALFVPSSEAKPDALEMIRPGSAIVGFRNYEQMLTAYFEGNRFNDPDLADWSQKVRKAYDRLVSNAPTVSKITTGSSNLEQIGYIDGTGITIRNMESLRRWLTDSGMAKSCPDSEFIAPPKKTLLGKLAL